MSVLDAVTARREGAVETRPLGPERSRRGGERPPLRLVEPPAEPRRRLVTVRLLGSSLLGALVIGIFVLATIHALVVQAQFELDRLDQQVADRRGELDGLRLEVARLESPQNIVTAALELGMVVPPERVYLPAAVPPGTSAPLSVAVPREEAEPYGHPSARALGVP